METGQGLMRGVHGALLVLVSREEILGLLRVKNKGWTLKKAAGARSSQTCNMQ